MKKRIEVSGGDDLASNPFGALEGIKVSDGGSTTATPPSGDATRGRKAPNLKRGRVDVMRQKAGRGGKTVTVLTGFKGISIREMQELARTIQRACGVGGTVKSGTIEIQGDQRDRAIEALKGAGFQPVRAGG